MLNTAVWQRTAEEQRRELLESSLMAIDGWLERADGVLYLIVSRMETTAACWQSCRQKSGLQVIISSGDHLLSDRSEQW